MTRFAPILLLLNLATIGLALPADPREQAELASLVATERLRAEVLRLPVAPQWSVGDFIERTGQRAWLDAVLDQAEQVGGPRWLDEQTCQVQLELRGGILADALLAAARELGDRSPLPPDELAKAVLPLRERVFSGTAVSVSPDAVDRLPATTGAPSAMLDASSRSAALRSARQQAIEEAFRAIDAIVLPDGSTLGERRRNDPRLDESVRGFLVARPLVPLGWDDDATARVAVTIPVNSLGRELSELIPGADTPTYRQQLAEQLRRQPRLLVGESRASPAGQPRLPDTLATPPWSRELILVEGNASAAGTRLQTIRAAEREAQRRLREAVLSLPMGDGVPLSRHAAASRSVESAVDRSLSLANTARVTFHADGSATVQLVLDGRVLWQAVVDAAR